MAVYTALATHLADAVWLYLTVVQAQSPPGSNVAPSQPKVAAAHQHDSSLLHSGAKPRNTPLIVEIDNHHTQRQDAESSNCKKNSDKEGVAATLNTPCEALTFTGVPPPPHASMQEYPVLRATEHAGDAFSANITNIIKALG